MYEKIELEVLKILYGFVKPTHIQFIDKWMDSLSQWERINYENSAMWIERLEKILSENNPQLDKYFVLLAGVIVDLDPNLDKKLSLIKKATPQDMKDLSKKIDLLIKHNMEMKNYLTKVLFARDLTRLIVKDLTDEEKSAVIFLRNKYSHPVLTAYRIKLIKPDEQGLFEFDMKKYMSSGRNLKVNEVTLFDDTKAKLLTRVAEIASLKASLWELHSGQF